jgi:hypothetical protein
MNMIVRSRNNPKPMLDSALRTRGNIALVRRLEHLEIVLVKGAPNVSLLGLIAVVLTDHGYVPLHFEDGKTLSVRTKPWAKQAPYRLIKDLLQQASCRAVIHGYYQIRLGHNDPCSWQMVREYFDQNDLYYGQDKQAICNQCGKPVELEPVGYGSGLSAPLYRKNAVKAKFSCGCLSGQPMAPTGGDVSCECGDLLTFFESEDSGWLAKHECELLPAAQGF